MQVTQNVFISWILSVTHLERRVWLESTLGVRHSLENNWSEGLLTCLGRETNNRHGQSRTGVRRE